MESKKTCIAMVPSPGLSHLIPLVEFAKLLLQQHNDYHITFLIPTLGPLNPSMQTILNTLPPNMDFTVLPQINIKDLPKTHEPATQMKLIVKHSIPFLQEEVKSLVSKTHLVALVFSMFSTDVHDVAKQFNLLSYLFFASGAFLFSFFLTLPKLDEAASSSKFLESYYETVNVPGLAIPFHVKELPNPVLVERSSYTYKSILDMCQKLSLFDGVIINTFTDLEPDAIRVLQERQKPCVYPVGPIIRNESSSEANMSVCLRWLEKEPPSSVVFISFGSGGTLSHEQLNELAFGLEMSGHKFLWVVRAPSKHSSSAYFSGQKDDPLEYLPNGFLERTKENGLVVTSWAPQVEILGHGSTGGFLSHCGWSSTLESVANGVPMIVWPLFAEQRMNAKLLTDVLKVALRPKVDDESGIVKREEVSKAIKGLMEGDESLEIRKRIKELSDGAATELSEHGSSRKSLSTLALKWN
jgi:hydroquinone glucosyltransferase